MSRVAGGWGGTEERDSGLPPKKAASGERNSGPFTCLVPAQCQWEKMGGGGLWVGGEVEGTEVDMV